MRRVSLIEISDIQTYIVGGKDAKIKHFPYQVSIELMDEHFCGGSIITQNIILTAAHCVTGYLPIWLKVRAGSIQREHGGQLIQVKKYECHPDYEMDESSMNDVAVVKLEKNLTFKNEIVSSIPLSGSNFKFSKHELAIISGFGYLEEEGELAKTLQEARVPILSVDECKSSLGSNYHPSMFCAGFLEKGGVDACSFDSGGPIRVKKQLIGVIAWGNGCAKPGYPGVYTNISYVRPWIDKTISKLSEE